MKYILQINLWMLSATSVLGFLTLQSFFMIIKKYENKVIGNTHPSKFTSVTLPYAKGNTAKTKQCSI